MQQNIISPCVSCVTSRMNDIIVIYIVFRVFLNDLYEHHCYRKYCNNLDESSEGFFWEEFYQTDSEQGSDSYYREHQEIQ